MAPTEGEEPAALLQRLPGVRLLTLTLHEATMVTPFTRRLLFGAEGLSDLEVRAGQDLMVEVPAEGRRFFRRRYSVRSLDRAAGTVALDIVLHGDGPGARWAAAVEPGDEVEAIGPRGKIFVAEDVDWHLFCADEASLPATLAMLESLPAHATAFAVVEVDGESDHLAPDGGPESLEMRWLHRTQPAGRDPVTAETVATLTLPDGHGHAYVFGELHRVAATRRALVDGGMDPGDIDHKGYWRLGVSNAAHGEPERSQPA